MFKKFKQLFKTKGFIFIFLLIAIFLPPALVKPAQGETTAIVTAVGLDKSKDNTNYTISLQVLTPQSSPKNNENLLVVSADGKSLVDALGKLSFKLGKTIGFNHCNVIVIGDTLKDQDILSLIDYFYRSGNMNLHTAIVSTDQETKIVLEQSAELNNTSNSSIQNNSNFNSQFFNSSRAITLGTFFNQYYNHESLSLVQFIEKELPPAEKQKNGESGGTGVASGGSGGTGVASGGSGGAESSGSGSASGGAAKGGSSGASSSSSTGGTDTSSDTSGASGEEGGGQTTAEQQKKLINNEGKSAVFKKGKKVAVLDQQIAKGTNFLDPDSKLGIIALESVSGGIYNNAKIEVLVEDSTVSTVPKINGDRLTLNVNLNFFAKIMEIRQPNDQDEFINAGKSYFTKEVKAAIDVKVKDLIAKTLEFSKLKNLDLFYAYTQFFKFTNKDFKVFLKNLPSADDYLQHLDIVVNIDVKAIN